MSTNVIITVIALILIAIITVIINGIEDINKAKIAISFRESLDLAGLPVVTFHQGKTKINFILDTGANISVIDEAMAKKLKISLTNKQTTITGIGGTSSALNVIELNFKYKDVELSDNFQVVDMSPTFSAIKASTGVTVHGLIGNDFMQKYKYVLDFENMVALVRK